MKQFEKRGGEVTWLPVDRAGQLDVHELHEAIREDTAAVTVMLANNETGVIFPIEEIAAMCRAKNVLFHTDAVQTPGKLKLDVKGDGRGFPFALGPQTARAQRHRAIVRATRYAVAAVRHGRRTGKRPTRRHGECRANRRLRSRSRAGDEELGK